MVGTNLGQLPARKVPSPLSNLTSYRNEMEVKPKEFSVMLLCKRERNAVLCVYTFFILTISPTGHIWEVSRTPCCQCLEHDGSLRASRHRGWVGTFRSSCSKSSEWSRSSWIPGALLAVQSALATPERTKEWWVCLLVCGELGSETCPSHFPIPGSSLAQPVIPESRFPAGSEQQAEYASYSPMISPITFFRRKSWKSALDLTIFTTAEGFA